MSNQPDVLRAAAMFAALGHEARLAIVRLLLAAHPEGLVVGEILRELGSAPSTLTHHLETLRREGLITRTRDGTFLRYRAHADGLRQLLDFLYEECCRRSRLIPLTSLASHASPKKRDSKP